MVGRWVGVLADSGMRSHCVCVCVWVCGCVGVCVCEKERERESKRQRKTERNAMSVRERLIVTFED